MRKLILVILVGILFSCNSKFKHDIGDVTKYKLYNNRVLILDTLTKYGKPYYKVEVTDCSECDEASELELED
jgi:hypothetical protein